MTKNMDKEFSLGLLEIFTKVITMKMSDMVMDKWFGLMALCMTENGDKEFSMVKDELLYLTGQLKKDILKIIFLNIP